MSETPDGLFVIRRRILAVVAASRVDSIVSLQAETVGKVEDAYPAVQVVESCWREFGGLVTTRSFGGRLDRSWIGSAPMLRPRVSRGRML